MGTMVYKDQFQYRGLYNTTYKEALDFMERIMEQMDNIDQPHYFQWVPDDPLEEPGRTWGDSIDHVENIHESQWRAQALGYPVRFGGGERIEYREAEDGSIQRVVTQTSKPGDNQ